MFDFSINTCSEKFYCVGTLNRCTILYTIRWMQTLDKTTSSSQTKNHSTKFRVCFRYTNCTQTAVVDKWLIAPKLNLSAFCSHLETFRHWCFASFSCGRCLNQIPDFTTVIAPKWFIDISSSSFSIECGNEHFRFPFSKVAQS